jgi:hypothetical protein
MLTWHASHKLQNAHSYDAKSRKELFAMGIEEASYSADYVRAKGNRYALR